MSTHKRIAFISTMEGSPWGGSEELWSRAAIEMLRQGFVIGVNVKWWPEIPKRVYELKHLNCEIIQRRSNLSILQKLIAKVIHKEIFYKWLDKFKPDMTVISQGASFDGVGWMEACSRRKIPYLVIAQAAGEVTWPFDELAERAAKAYQNARKCFFVSKKNLAIITKQLAINFKNAQIIRNPYNIFCTMDVPWPDDKNIFKLACVGRLEPSAKGQDILFEVLQLEKWKNRSIEVTLFGTGHCFNSLKNLKEFLGLNKIKFAGFEENVKSIWESHHALILPSRYEGMPLVIVEAMLCGRPCIVTDIGGNAELIEDNIDGFVAKAPTVEFLDEAMERAWEKRHAWREMGQTAAKKVRKYTVTNPINDFVQYVERLL